MSRRPPSSTRTDTLVPYATLFRSGEVQILTYAPALAEVRRGAKRTHWKWWIFPQLAKLGRSSTAQQFAIHSVKEAQAYLDHPILGPRYLECVTALQDLNTSDADAVFGEIEDRKSTRLNSSH